MNIRNLGDGIIWKMLWLAIISCCGGYLPARPAEPVRVLVVATIHGGHESNPEYSYQDLFNILSTYSPDAICVEIRPEDFRRNSYLKEMMMAAMFGLNRGLKVHPVDWWGADDRAQREVFIKSAEYKVKLKEEERLVARNKVMQNFDKKYGSLEKLWNANRSGYEFFNGKEYNRYIEEMYRVLMTVYGDGPMNLSYRTRNDHMLGLIKKALAGKPGRRLVILTGAEHKHYFDRALAGLPGVKLVKFPDILPLRPAPLDDNIVRFLKDNLAKGYFDDSTPDGVDGLYQGALVPLLHGLDMDGFPETVPLDNLPKAKLLLDEWQAQHPGSVLLQYELAWAAFLAADYRQAIGRWERIGDRLEQIPAAHRSFVKSYFDRNLGLCHDLLGEREQAITCYQRGMDLCKSLGFSDSYIKYIYRDFKNNPYQRKVPVPAKGE